MEGDGHDGFKFVAVSSGEFIQKEDNTIQQNLVK